MILTNKKQIKPLDQQIKELNAINIGLKISYPNKETYNSVIPLNIFQTWHTKNLPPQMQETVNYIKENNPSFKHYLYDDNDCYDFIKYNFSPIVLNTFNSLMPGAYKADLWRYCILYKFGGIYLDIKYSPVQNFNFLNLTEKEYWVLDANGKDIYNALMVCKPGNPILLKLINQIIINVKTKFYGVSPLSPTGPNLVGKFFSNFEKKNFELQHYFYIDHHNRFISFNGYIIFKNYNKYIEEHDKYKKVPHYDIMWSNHNIYR